MSFFPEAEPSNEPPSQPVRRPVWFGPPEDEVGIPVPMRPVVVRGGDVVVALTTLTAYSQGVTMQLAVRARRDLDRVMRLMDMVNEPPADALRVGVDMGPQGNGWIGGMRTTFAGVDPRQPDSRPERPVVMMSGGGGGGRSYNHGLWVWPLPEGPLAVVVRWTAMGIEETRLDQDAGSIRDAARQSRPLW